MTVRQLFPEGLAEMAPGPHLGAALAWTRNAAYREYHFTQSLLGRLPAVFTALDAGAICRSKAWLFTELCAGLTEEQAQMVAERLLPQAGRLTTGELAARIKKLAIALDPEWAARRYAAAVRDRDVIGYLDEDGTATVTGRRLPVEQAATACARIEDLAKAAKRAGYPGRIGPLRADIYLGLLDGRWTHHSREEIITDLLAQAQTTPAPDQPTPDQPAPDDARQRPTPDDSFATDRVPADDALVTNDDPETGSDPGAEGAAGGDIGSAADAAAETDTPAGDTSATGKAGQGGRSGALGARVGVELRVGLSTLLAHDRHPGDIPGWGTVTAETARTLAAAQHRTEWRYALTDQEGRLVLGGITHHRPRASEGNGRGSGPGVGLAATGQAREPIRGRIVELHIPSTLLAELAAHPATCGPWAAVIDDIATQYRSSATDAPDGAGGAGSRTRPPGSPGRCCAATSRSGTGLVSTRGVAARPGTPTSTTPSTTVVAGQPRRPTPGRCAGTTTGSSTRAGGGCASPSPGILSGQGRTQDTALPHAPHRRAASPRATQTENQNPGDLALGP